jgi:peptide/nickel transport system permease protein
VTTTSESSSWPRRGRWTAHRRAIVHHRLQRGPLVFGLVLLAGLVVLATIGGVLLPGPNEQQLDEALSAPGAAGHPLGSDPLGRDVLAWIIGSIRTGLLVSAGVVAVSASVGVAIGLVAGYFGGWSDTVLMRLADLQLAVPPLVLFIAASVVVGNSMPSLILLLSLVGWVPYARVVRTRTLAERERAYVAAARLAGAGRLRLLIVHLLPSALTVVVVIASLQAGYVLLWESSLSFLGLGIQPPRPSFGFMIAQGREQLVTAWWIVAFPGLAIVLLVLAFNLVGDALRDRFGVQDDDVVAR